ncbi:hypothetical protein ACFYXM_11855 [Streptomyces sp. NPDC002476]|uniref:hypothetical protein n=1 Tax=Streptomyces sp. NPDC002476 TaxID=3364648 RepID=UPI00369AB123
MLSAAVSAALVAGYWAGSAHVLERRERTIDRWARKHAVRRAFTRRRHLHWWLAQLWFAGRIAYDFVLAPVATVRHIREVRQQRRETRQSVPPVTIVDVRPAVSGQQQGAQQ